MDQTRHDDTPGASNVAPHQWPPPPMDHAMSGRSDGPRGKALLAWIVILLACAVVGGRHMLPKDDAASSGLESEDRVGVMLMELQAKYVVGAGDFAGNQSTLYTSIEPALNRGTVGQRQRFVILAAELMGPAEARRVLAELSDLIAKAEQQQQQQHGQQTASLPPEKAEVQRILHEMYMLPSTNNEVERGEEIADEISGAIDALRSRTGSTGPELAVPADDAPVASRISDADRALLVQELGWFGELALVPPATPDASGRSAVLAPAQTVMTFLLVVVFAVLAIGLLGFVGLIVMAILAGLGKVRSGMAMDATHHGLFAETFAVWIVLFLALQLGAGAVASAVPQLALVWVGVAFMLSLLALMWPVLRGVPWRDVRRGIGWVGGGAGALQPLVGLAGYAMMLPILAVGVVVTLGLFKLQEFLDPPGEGIQSASGPAHPIIEQLADGDWLARIMVLFLGAIAAPIVEETMFRGALYRHLRQASASTGMFLSIALATLINSFIFAAVHPQGWVAIPALMSLAIAFSLMREWQGSVIPAMIMHGTSNFLVLSILLIAISI